MVGGRQVAHPGEPGGEQGDDHREGDLPGGGVVGPDVGAAEDDRNTANASVMPIDDLDAAAQPRPSGGDPAAQVELLAGGRGQPGEDLRRAGRRGGGR